MAIHRLPSQLLIPILALLLTFPLSAYADNEAQQRQQLNQLNKELQSLQKLLTGFKSQRSKLQTTLNQSEVSIGNIQTKIRQIQKQLSREQQQLTALQQRRSKLQTAKKSQQKHIEQQILAAFQAGQEKNLKLLLNQQQPDQITRALTYYDYFNQARTEQISSYVEIIRELDSLEPKIQTKTTSLVKARNQLQQQRDELLTTRKQRQSSLAKINSTIKTKDQQLQKIIRDRSEMERLLEAMEQTLANINIPGNFSPISKLKGKLPWPVIGKPSNRFGNRRNGTSQRWQGLSIPAREGSNVSAIHHGRVVFADWLRGSGLLVIIDHGDGYMTLYAHNQSLLKETGEWVNTGDNIATVGDSGGQASAGLYFEIRYNGKPIDPRRWCTRV